MDPAATLTKIAKKLRDKELILFVGSGMSAPYFPTWAGLLTNSNPKPSTKTPPVRPKSPK
jgi:hypothetical protein